MIIYLSVDDLSTLILKIVVITKASDENRPTVGIFIEGAEALTGVPDLPQACVF